MPLQYTFGLLSPFYLLLLLLLIIIFFSSLNSCYNANLVCSIGTVATVWFQPLHYCRFLFFSFLFLCFFFFFFVRGNIVLSTLLFLFIYLFLYIKLLVNTINCHNIFTIVDMLIPYRLK